MAFAQGSRSGLSYQAETTFATAPVTPTLVEIPYVTHTLNLTKERVQGGDILPDRMTRHDRHGNSSVAGDIVVELRQGEYDPFLESAFMGAWSTDVLTPGVTLKSFHIEDSLLDITQHRLFTGMAVSQASFTIRPNEMVTTTFSFVGSGMTVSGTSFDGTKTASSTNPPFDAYSGSLEVGNNGGALSAVSSITSIEFSINNSLSPTFVVGSATTPQLEYGMAMVEGTITAYVEDASLINRFLNETESAFEVSVDGPGGSTPYTFLFPRVKFNGADMPVENPQSRLMTIPFVALYDTAEACNIKLTRTS